MDFCRAALDVNFGVTICDKLSYLRAISGRKNFLMKETVIRRQGVPCDLIPDHNGTVQLQRGQLLQCRSVADDIRVAVAEPTGSIAQVHVENTLW